MTWKDAELPATEVAYVLLLFALFVLPKILQRFRIPTAITSFALGAASALTAEFFAHDTTVALLATFGIVSLFLFAGLEVEVAELRAEARLIFQHLLVRLGALLALALALARLLHLPPRPSALAALALVTPSTGFILDSLDALGLRERERFWVRSKAIATEILALAVLFVTLQSVTLWRLAASALAIAALIAVLPWTFRVFARLVVPYAPKSEFAFLIMVAVVSAILTRELGVYYLVGAFIVGMAAQRFRERLPSMASERMLHAVESFASIFVPFYFFHAGLELRSEDFSITGLTLGILLILVLVPARILLVWLPRRIVLRETLYDSVRVGIPLLPTLVFSLVIVQILRERFAAPPWLLGGLTLYTVATTVLPSFLLRTPPPEFDTPEIPELEADALDG